MLATLRSEFKKFLTVRSTYIWSGAALVITAFFAIYVFGYVEARVPIEEADYMMQPLGTALGIFVTFATILSILLVAYEYRYNTIGYTLTASNSRMRVLLSKIIVMLSYVTVGGIVVLAVAYFGTKLGISMRGGSMIAQDIDIWQTAWRFAVYAWGYVLVGIVIATLVRGLVGSIVAFFLLPTVEQLSSLILKENAKFLPFRSLDSIIQTPVPGMASLTSKAALGVFVIYLSVALVLASVLFVKRDAN